MSRFQESDNGIIMDTETNLQWHVGPDKDTTWDEAKEWVDNLVIDGGEWRMPTVAELKRLYQKGKGTWNIKIVFRTTGWWVWSRESDLSSAWAVYFFYGRACQYSRSYSDLKRVFAVRSI